MPAFQQCLLNRLDNFHAVVCLQTMNNQDDSVLQRFGLRQLEIGIERESFEWLPYFFCPELRGETAGQECQDNAQYHNRPVIDGNLICIATVRATQNDILPIGLGK